MLQSWFEMKDIEHRRFNTAVWVPLRAYQQLEQVGKYGHDGYKEAFFGCGTLAVPIEKRATASKLGWSELQYNHSPWIKEDGLYVPAEVYIDPIDNLEGICLVLEQCMDGPDVCEWHLNQDLVLALGLKREGDTWVRPLEGYVEVARLKRKPNGTPNLLEVRAEHLKDYLCARKMSLLMTIYWQRHAVVANKPQFTWIKDRASKTTETDRWEGGIVEIHEGGQPYGEKMAVFHVSRTDVDELEDIPVMENPSDDNLVSRSWVKDFSGEKCFDISGELWRNEWIEASNYSPKVARDKLPATVFFITDAEGRRENRDTLVQEGRWLWFRPSVVMDLISRRGGHILWYTGQTGNVGCLQYYGVHFGINSLGLVNVYAKDIALLPDWQQQIWAGYNVAPDGKVSQELLAAQVNAVPARTQAPEAYLEAGLEEINKLSTDHFKFSLFKEHKAIPEILKQCHRFRAIDKVGLYALAKDLSRLIVDSIDVPNVQLIVAPPKGEKWGSIKSLENLLAIKIAPEKARKIMSPLVGIYELRHADAHLPSSTLDEALTLIGVDNSTPSVHQGHQIMHACVQCIYQIIYVLERW